MKKRIFISLSIAVCLCMASCEKDVAVNQEKVAVEEIKNNLSRPLEFSSKESLLDAIKMQSRRLIQTHLQPGLS